MCTAEYGVLVVMAVVMWSWDASCVHCEGYCSTQVLVKCYTLALSSRDFCCCGQCKAMGVAGCQFLNGLWYLCR